MTEETTDIVLDHILQYLHWAWSNEGQRYRLRKALAAWLPDNDDGKTAITKLGDAFVASNEIDIDEIVARPKAPISKVYMGLGKGTNAGQPIIAIFRDDPEFPDHVFANFNSPRMLRQGQCLQDMLAYQGSQPIRLQMVDIDDIPRVWVDGVCRDMEDLERELEMAFQRWIDGKGDTEEAYAAGLLPNMPEDFYMETIFMEVGDV